MRMNSPALLAIPRVVHLEEITRFTYDVRVLEPVAN